MSASLNREHIYFLGRYQVVGCNQKSRFYQQIFACSDVSILNSCKSRELLIGSQSRSLVDEEKGADARAIPTNSNRIFSALPTCFDISCKLWPALLRITFFLVRPAASSVLSIHTQVS